MNLKSLGTGVVHFTTEAKEIYFNAPYTYSNVF